MDISQAFKAFPIQNSGYGWLRGMATDEISCNITQTILSCDCSSACSMQVEKRIIKSAKEERRYAMPILLGNQR